MRTSRRTLRPPTPKVARTMTLAQGSFLFAMAAIGSALNAVAGGGSFFTFPALVLIGIPPIVANATSTVALWPGSLSSATAYRKDVARHRGLLLPLAVASLCGGSLGAWLLLRTGDTTFAKLVPWLLLTATVLFAVSRPLVRWLASDTGPGGPGNPQRSSWGLVLAQLAIAVYGGYFGGGMGILMLAGLAVFGLTDIHAMNGIKSVLGTVINGVAVVLFVAAGAVRWPEALVMVGGAVLGGHVGATLARRVAAVQVQRGVVAAGLVLTGYFFWRQG